MCGRLDQHYTTNRYADYLEGESRDMWAHSLESYNVAPSQEPIVAWYEGEVGKLVLGNVRWGFVPTWAKEDYAGPRPINARAETVAKSPMFRQAFQSRRCLIPADGYYEWRKEGSRKQPYYFRLQSGDPMFLAGIMAGRHRHDGLPDLTFAIIVGPANTLASPVHDRMPIILPPEAWTAWMDPANHDNVKLSLMLRPYSADAMACDAVSMAVNNPKNAGADCIVPIAS